MNNKIKDISELQSKPVPILSDLEAGEKYSRWSYLNIYSLESLRDIYLITKELKFKTKKNITEKVNELLVSKDEWEERKVLEYLNALVKFELLQSNYEVKKNVFIDSIINSELSTNDQQILIEIFFTYFRFKEISSWFISLDKDFHKNFDKLGKSNFILDSDVLYYYSENSRFIDTFLTPINSNYVKYYIDENHSHLMRFWDVFIKWGTSLRIIDRINLSRASIKTYTKTEISVAYFIKPFSLFNLIDFINSKFNTRDIWIPELIFVIANEFRFSVEEIKKFIVSEIETNEMLTYERTSEIFLIKGKSNPKKVEDAIYLFPKMYDYYISNLILRK